MIKHILILIALFVMQTNTTNAQEKYFFEKISVAGGLTNSVVLCTFQDHLGYLWIGTVDGLNRYDGYEIKAYKNIPNDTTSLPHNFINSIGEDADGNLLVGTTDFVSKYDRINNKFSQIQVEKGPQINPTQPTNFLLDTKGRLWISTDFTGVQLYSKSKNKFNGINFRDYSGNSISFSSAGYVWKVVELKNGNILASDENYGIFIFNSEKNEFQPFFMDPKLNLRGVFQVFECSDGKLWFLGLSNISVYNPITYEMKRLSAADEFISLRRNITYYNIYEDKNKLFIACDFGILESNLDGTKFELITKSLQGLYPKNFYRDNFGIYWISTGGSGLIKFDPSKKPFQFFKFDNINQNDARINPISDIVPNPLAKNNLIISNNTSGIFSFDRKSLKFKKMLDLQSQQDSYNLLTDEGENLWFTDQFKLKKYNLKTGKTESYNFEKINYSRDLFSVNKMKYGPDRNIWIANRQGVQIFDPDKKTFTRIPSIMNKEIGAKLLNKIRTIANTEKPLAALIKVGEGQALTKEFELKENSKVLIVNFGEGRQTGLLINMFDYGWLEDSNGKKLWTAGVIQNTFYAGGGFKNRSAFGCLDLPKGKYEINYLSDIGHNYGNFNVPASPDSDFYGIQAFKINDNQYQNLNSEINSKLDNSKYAPFEIILDLEFSRKYINTAWLSANGVGLIKFNITDSTYKQFRFDNGTQNFPLENLIFKILEDKDGILWLGTAVGLIRFDPETEKHQLITQQDGLVSNVVVFLIEDNKGNLWIGTPAGISMLNKSSDHEKFSFINYDNTDGLHGLPLNNSICLNSDGELFYGGYGGINAFYPGGTNNSLSIPIITSLNISGIPIEKIAGELNLDKNISETNSIQLPFNYNNLSFEFASIHYSRPAKNKLAYKLDGIDKDWNYSNRRFASYLNLSPGKYVFSVKGSNGDGVWNPNQKQLQIVIEPPWWRTTLAYVGYFFLFVGFIFTVDRVQRRRLLSKERTSAAINEANLRAQLAESESERKTKELEEARQLQLSMLPQKIPQISNLDIAVYMKTATEVGGDYYDFHVSIDGTLTIVIGDATGHGMKAGTMVTSTKSLFNALAPNSNIVDIFHEMTRCLKLMQLEKLSMCMTMLKIKENKLYMSSAGMPPVFIYKRESQTIEEYLMKGMPLGTFKDFPYSVIEKELNVGDTILLMSDGFPELMNDKKELIGYKRARNLFEESAPNSPETIINNLKEYGLNWVDDKEPDDDVTFVVIKII